jgi:predicted  nucleic acid-binding Zn-ribbon protein
LHEIASVLKKKDDPELQTLAKEADVLQNKTATSKLHKAVTIHGDAKTAVLEARQARANLHASWKQYLESAITTWRSFIEDFDKEDRRLEELIGQADSDLQVAPNSLDEAKKAATEEELQAQIETIEDEDEGLDRTAKSSQVMREGLKGMLDGLEQLHARTEEIGEESGSKRQRVDDGKKSSAMQPFGGAGR